MHPWQGKQNLLFECNNYKSCRCNAVFQDQKVLKAPAPSLCEPSHGIWDQNLNLRILHDITETISKWTFNSTKQQAVKESFLQSPNFVRVTF